MRKVYKVFNEVFPYAMIIMFIADAYNNFSVDYSRISLDIAAIIGWMSFIEVRKDYNTLNDMIMGITKDESQG